MISNVTQELNQRCYYCGVTEGESRPELGHSVCEHCYEYPPFQVHTVWRGRSRYTDESGETRWQDHYETYYVAQGEGR